MSRRTTVPVRDLDRTPDPAAVARAEKALARAKARGTARGQIPGDLENVPRFDAPESRMQPAPGHNRPPPSSLSDQTVKDLEGLAAAQPAPQELPEDENEPVWDEATVRKVLDVSATKANRILEILNPEEAKTPEEIERRTVEGRLREIDIGQFLMNGVTTQIVPIIPAHLVVAYQTISDELEVFIDEELAKEAAEIRRKRGADGDISQREYIRRSNEWALAVHVQSYKGTAWPASLNADGTVNRDSMQQRLRKVRALPSPVLPFLTRNLGWFLDRVQAQLNLGVLGNG